MCVFICNVYINTHTYGIYFENIYMYLHVYIYIHIIYIIKNIYLIYKNKVALTLLMCVCVTELMNESLKPIRQYLINHFDLRSVSIKYEPPERKKEEKNCSLFFIFSIFCSVWSDTHKSHQFLFYFIFSFHLILFILTKLLWLEIFNL